MSRFALASLTLKQKLAAVAVALGALAVFGDPYGGGTVQVDTRELALMVEEEVDHVTAGELADWILAGRTDYRLLDLRDADAYVAYHIPTAEPVAVAELLDYPLLRNEKIVLYSGGGIHSAQAWFLLKAHRFAGVYMLLGGLEAWKEEVLFPALPADAAAEARADFERRREAAAFFGGAPRSGAEEAPAAVEAELPQVAMPAAPPVARPVKKKKKEGC